MTTRGCRAGSGSARRMSSYTVQGTLPSPNSRKRRLAAIGLSFDQPEWISGGRPTRDSSSPRTAMTWAIETQRVTRRMNRRGGACDFSDSAGAVMGRRSSSARESEGHGRGFDSNRRGAGGPCQLVSALHFGAVPSLPPPPVFPADRYAAVSSPPVDESSGRSPPGSTLALARSGNRFLVRVTDQDKRRPVVGVLEWADGGRRRGGLPLLFPAAVPARQERHLPLRRADRQAAQPLPGLPQRLGLGQRPLQPL